MSPALCATATVEQLESLPAPEHPSTILAVIERQVQRVAIRSISPRTLDLRLGQPLDPDLWLTIELFDKSRSCWLLKLLGVKESIAQVDGTWLVHCAFIQGLTADELRGLFGEAA